MINIVHYENDKRTYLQIDKDGLLVVVTDDDLNTIAKEAPLFKQVVEATQKLLEWEMSLPWEHHSPQIEEELQAALDAVAKLKEAQDE